MEQKRDLAIILKTIPFEERHRIVTALTEQHGVVTAMARGSIQSRRFGGTLDPFSASEWHFTEKAGAELLRLEQAHIRRSFEGLRRDFDALSMASLMNELILKVAPKHEACPDLFRLHSNALAFLEDQVLAQTQPTTLRAAENAMGSGVGATAQGASQGERLVLLNGYITKLLQWSGSQPQLAQCLNCETSLNDIHPGAHLTCVVADAAWVCSECRAVETLHVRDRQGQSFHQAIMRVTPKAIRDFHMSLQIPIRQIPAIAEASRREHLELFQFLEALCLYHIPGFDQQPLKSLRFVEASYAQSPR